MIHSYVINGLPVQTGDIICTTDGGRGFISGQFWWAIGKLIPGEVDHIVIYTGPNGKCVEAGPKGVICFEIPKSTWDSREMLTERWIEDDLHGVVYPCLGRGFTEQREHAIREGVAQYCIEQANMRKPYNINFLDSSTETAFYCSQLAYKAYLNYSLDFNTGKGVPDIPGTSSIIFPQEIWESCQHEKA